MLLHRYGGPVSTHDLRDDAVTPPSRLSAAPGDPMGRWRGGTRGVLVANLIGQIGIIVTGGAVRLTGSGLGCDQWPLCEPGSFTPRFHEATSIHPYIEFGNRTLSGVLLLLALAVLALVRTDRTRAASYRRLGIVPLAGVLTQAVLGGLVVLLDLAPGWVALHYLVSAALVAASIYLLYRHGEGDGDPYPVVPRAAVVAGRLAAAALVPVLGLGVLVTGSGPHGGDDEIATRFPFDPVVVTRLHAAAVWLFVGVAVALAVAVLRRTATVRSRASARHAVVALLAVTALQSVIGYAQYLTGLPVVLVGLHMLGSALLIAATAWAVLTLRVRPQ